MGVVDRVDGFTYIRPYSDWVKESIRQNAPWNEMVHDMLTAEGQVWDNPAAGFYVRDQGMPLDNLNNSIRMFLGTRIGCAQCHDHPFDRWTQKEFYQLAAFVGGIDYGIRGPQMNKVSAKEVDTAASSPESSSTTDITRWALVARKSSMWGCVKTGTASSPDSDVRKTVSCSPSSPRCSRYTDSGGVWKLSVSVAAASDPCPVTPETVTV